MAFNTVQTQGLVLEKDYLHDFDSGDINLVFNIDHLQGIEKVVTYTKSLDSSAPYKPTPAIPSHINPWFVLIQDGPNPLVDTIDNYTNITFDGCPTPNRFTRMNIPSSGDPNAGSIYGPYNVTYSSPGAKIIKAWLYGLARKDPSVDLSLYNLRYQPLANPWLQGHFSGAAPFAIPATNPKKFFEVPELGFINSDYTKSWNLNIYQKAISITRLDSSIGAVFADGTIIPDMNTTGNNIITLDKSTNRGDNLVSIWEVYKLDINGNYQVATLGVDYQFNLGNLSADLITIQWLLSGQYKILNKSEGTTSVSAGVNTNESSLYFNVELVVVDTVTFPIINTIVTPIVSYDNVIITTNPLEGITKFTVLVDVSLDFTNAVWSQVVDANPPVILQKSAADWKQEMSNRLLITCVVKQGTNFEIIKTGFGPHTFNLSPGQYEIGFVTNQPIVFPTFILFP